MHLRDDRALTKTRRNQVRRLVLTYFELIGADIEEVGNDLFRVEMARDQAAELEGGLWGPASPWTDQAQVTYYFTFTPEVAEGHGDAELVGLGSHRLQQVIQSIRRIAGATRVWLPAYALGGRLLLGAAGGEGISYRPFFLFTLRLDYENTAKPSDILRVAVDRVDQIALTQLAEIVAELPLESGFPATDDGALVEEATADFDRSFAIAFEGALQALEGADHSWAIRAQSIVEQERARLAAYYAERERDGEQVEQEKNRRLSELEASRPKVLVRTQGVSELFLPVARLNGTARYLAFDMAAYRGTPIPSSR